MDTSRHVSVMAREALAALVVRPDGTYLDGTLGGGGHTRLLAEAAGPGGRVIGLDRDASAVERAGRDPLGNGARVDLVQADFRNLAAVLDRLGVATVDGVLFDLGLSSDQLDDPARGFSFQADGPLDMRMDRRAGATAADLLNTLAEGELERLFRAYGEEPDARRVAKAVVAYRRDRPLAGTAELAGLVERAKGGRRGRLHPATRVFQALRMAVNDELGALEAGLEGALARLAAGGRLAVITFHSLEDRLVKQFIKRHTVRWENLAAGGRRQAGEPPLVHGVTRKPVTPSDEEVEQNARARSAKLRVAERERED